MSELSSPSPRAGALWTGEGEGRWGREKGDGGGRRAYTRHRNGREIETNPQNTARGPPGPGEQGRPVPLSRVEGWGESGNILGPQGGHTQGGRGDLPATCLAAPDLPGADKC